MTAHAAQAATLTIGVLQLADDDRLEVKRVEQADPHQPGGPLTRAVEVAVKESAFELDTAKPKLEVKVKLKVRSARSADKVKAALQQLSKVGAAAVVLDIPAAWMRVASGHQTLRLKNGDDAAIHAVGRPARARPWQPFAVDKQCRLRRGVGDRCRLRSCAQLALQDFVAAPHGGPCRFAGRGLGTALERFGAPQLSRRFSRAASRPITDPDWAADVATKAVIEAAIGQPNAPSSTQVSKALRRPDFTREGSKAFASSNAHDRRRRRDRYRTGRRPDAS